jgi:uncharacterized protein YciI
MKLFAVIRAQGSAWRPAVPLESQPDWDAHASFMNGLQKDGFILLGGPLDDTPEVLLIVRANTPAEIMERFAGDPWTTQGLLRISRISPWTLRLGSLA